MKQKMKPDQSIFILQNILESVRFSWILLKRSEATLREARLVQLATVRARGPCVANVHRLAAHEARSVHSLLPHLRPNIPKLGKWMVYYCSQENETKNEA